MFRFAPNIIPHLSFVGVHVCVCVPSYVSGNDGAILISNVRYTKCMSNMWVSISTGHTIWWVQLHWCHTYTHEPMCAWKRTKFHCELWMLQPQTVIGFTVPYLFITPLKWHDEENDSLATCKYPTDTLLYSNCSRIYSTTELKTSRSGS